MRSPEEERIRGAVAEATREALIRAETTLPPDVRRAIERAAACESDPVAQEQFHAILANIAYAEEHKLPICQDTGVQVIYVTLPSYLPLSPAITEGVREGVRTATSIIPLRPNVVDPLTRANTGDNCGQGMPAIHVRPGGRFEITVMPKGAGSENVSRLAMMLPSESESIPAFVVETLLKAGGKPCPPVVVGLGIGGTFDGAAALAKEALLEPIDTMTPFEQDICDAINSLWIGPMGLGGRTTALAVRAKTAGCHTASLPVAVNVQCWACRRATVEVKLP